MSSKAFQNEKFVTATKDVMWQLSDSDRGLDFIMVDDGSYQ